MVLDFLFKFFFFGELWGSRDESGKRKKKKEKEKWAVAGHMGA